MDSKGNFIVSPNGENNEYQMESPRGCPLLSSTTELVSSSGCPSEATINFECEPHTNCNASTYAACFPSSCVRNPSMTNLDNESQQLSTATNQYYTYPEMMQQQQHSQQPMMYAANHQPMGGLCSCTYCLPYYQWYPSSVYPTSGRMPPGLHGIDSNGSSLKHMASVPPMNSGQLSYWNNNSGRPLNLVSTSSNAGQMMAPAFLPYNNMMSMAPPQGRSEMYNPSVSYFPPTSCVREGMHQLDFTSTIPTFSPPDHQPPMPNHSSCYTSNVPDQMNMPPNQTSKSPIDRMAFYTPIYVNHPVPNNTDHFQRKKPTRFREPFQVGWINLYLEVEKTVDKPTENGRIAWMNDMHQIVYTKFTSGVYTRWQYEMEFDILRNLIEYKCDEADWIFNTYPFICKCGERFQERFAFTNHSNRCRESDYKGYRCLCGRILDEQEEFFLHIFNGELECVMAAYHLWIYLEKYRKRRYKCACGENFSNFWVFFVHLAECGEYRKYFAKNCSYWKKENNTTAACCDSGGEGQHTTWPLPLSAPLKSLVFQSKIQ